MVKKAISVLLALCAVCWCVLPAAAQRETGKIAVKLNSDIAGATYKDAGRLIELKTDNVVLSTRGDGPVYTVDYAGTPVSGELKAGRTYNIYYSLTAADGYTLPDTLNDGAVEIECGNGVKVISTQIVSLNDRNGNPVYRGVKIYATVTVDSSTFQRIIGYIYDVILKIKAWSLY